MQTLTATVKDKATAVAGSTVGAVADPAAGLRKVTAFARKPAVVLGCGALLLTYLLARTRRRH